MSAGPILDSDMLHHFPQLHGPLGDLIRIAPHAAKCIMRVIDLSAENERIRDRLKANISLIESKYKERRNDRQAHLSAWELQVPLFKAVIDGGCALGTIEGVRAALDAAKELNRSLPRFVESYANFEISARPIIDVTEL